MTRTDRPALYGATVTPFTPDGALDVRALRPYFTFLREAGLDGVFVCGTTGEFQTLEADERATVITAALEVFGSDGVIAHVGSGSLRQALRLAREALDLGATRLSAITPYFQPAGNKALTEYYVQLRELVGEGELYAYHFEDRSGVSVSPELLASIARAADLAGVKISGKSQDDLMAYLASAPDGFRVMTGGDAGYTDFVRGGGFGGIFACAAACPAAFVGLREALAGGETQSIEAAHRAMLEVVDALAAGHPAFVKTALVPDLLADATCRVAVDGPDAEQVATIRRVLGERDADNR